MKVSSSICLRLPLSDGALVERVAQGDRRALTDLRTRYEMTLYAEAYHLTFDPMDSTEAVESVFLDLLHHAEMLPRGNGHVHRWLVERTRARARAILMTSSLRSTVMAPIKRPA